MGGCALPDKKPTHEEMEQAQLRYYPGRTPGQIYDATKKVFELADGDDVAFSKNPQSLKAKRTSFMLFSVIIEDWEIQAIEENGGTKVHTTAQLNVDGFTMYPRDTGGYALFYRRLDYLLGLSDQWMTCEEYELQIEKNPTWGRDGWWCTNADDNLPVTLRPVQASES